jgi:hypothetical protein
MNTLHKGDNDDYDDDDDDNNNNNNNKYKHGYDIHILFHRTCSQIPIENNNKYTCFQSEAIISYDIENIYRSFATRVSQLKIWHF